MTQTESSEYLGLSRNYFAVIKKTTPLLYRFYTLYGGGDLVKGYYKYLDYVLGLKESFEEVYYGFTSVYALGKLLHSKGVYSSVPASISSINRLICSTKLSIKGVKLIKKIVRICNEGSNLPK